MSIVSNGSHHSSAVYQYPYITSSIPNASAVNPGMQSASVSNNNNNNTATTAIVVPSTTTATPLTLLNNPLLNNAMNMNAINNMNTIKSPINTMPATLPSLSAVNSGSMGSHYTPTAIKSTSVISSPTVPAKIPTSYSNNTQNTGKIYIDTLTSYVMIFSYANLRDDIYNDTI